MAWIVGIVVLILLVVSAGFRMFAGVLVLIFAVGGFIFWQYLEYEERESKSRIPQSELVFEGMSLKPSYGSSYDLIGRIVNNSNKYTLKSVQLKLTFRDCEKDNKNCIVIYEDSENIYINIPPKQARDFKESVYLYSDISLKVEMAWDYKIQHTKAE